MSSPDLPTRLLGLNRFSRYAPWLFGSMVLVVVALMLTLQEGQEASPEAVGGSASSKAPSGKSEQGGRSLLTGSGEQGAAARQVVGSVSGMVSIELIQVGPAVALEPIRVRVIDGGRKQQWTLSAGDTLQVSRKPSRQIKLEALSPGWVLSAESISLSPSTASENPILATPRHTLAIEVMDQVLGRPVLAYSLKLFWRDGATGILGERPDIRVQSPDGSFIIDGIPIDSGAYRVEVRTETHRAGRTKWLDTRPRNVTTQIIWLRDLEASTGEIKVMVKHQATQTPIEGIRVQAFEDVPNAQIKSLHMTEDGIVALRESRGFDRELKSVLESIPAQKTNARGAARFAVPLGRTFRIAIGSKAHPVMLGEPVTMREGLLTQEVVFQVAEPGSLAGQVRTDTQDSKMSVVEAVLLGPDVRLSTRINHEGFFQFRVVAPGPYLLAVNRKVRSSTGVERTIRVASQEVEVSAGSDQVVDIILNDQGAPGHVAGSLDNPIHGELAMGMVAIFERPEHPDPKQVPRPLMVTVLNDEASFSFSKVPPGTWSLVAMTQSKDLHELSLLFGEVDVPVGDQVAAPVYLEAQKGIISVVGIGDADADPDAIRLDLKGASALWTAFIHELPPLAVSSGRTSVVWGVPEGAVVIRGNFGSQNVGTSGTAEVDLD